MDYSPSGSSVHGILQLKILEWVAISFSRGLTEIEPRSPPLQEVSFLFHYLGSHLLTKTHALFRLP